MPMRFLCNNQLNITRVRSKVDNICPLTWEVRRYMYSCKTSSFFPLALISHYGDCKQDIDERLKVSLGGVLEMTDGALNYWETHINLSNRNIPHIQR